MVQRYLFFRTGEEKASQGGVLSLPPIHAALVEQLGHPVPFPRHIACWAVGLALIWECRYEYAAVSPLQWRL